MARTQSTSKSNGDPRTSVDQQCGLLDALVAMRWIFQGAVEKGADLPNPLVGRILRVNSELDAAISELKMHIQDGGLHHLPPTGRAKRPRAPAPRKT